MFVSFVVATFNCAALVPGFVRGFERLDFADFEVLVCDGGSTDETVSAISKCRNVRIIKSTPDSGIYDAWNSALPDCHGDYIAFLGIDDLPQGLFCRKAKTYVDGAISPPALIYGDVVVVRGDRQRLKVTPENLRFVETDVPVMDFAQPGALNHRKLFDGNQFDLSFRLAGDLDFYIRVKALLRRFGTLKIAETQAVIGADGVSNSAKAYSVYCEEFSAIELRQGVNFGSLRQQYRLKSVFGYVPAFHDFLRNISWRLKSSRRSG